MNVTLLCLLNNVHWRELVKRAATADVHLCFLEDGPIPHLPDCAEQACVMLAEWPLFLSREQEMRDLAARKWNGFVQAFALRPEDYREFDRIGLSGADLLFSLERPPSLDEMRQMLAGYFDPACDFGMIEHIPDVVLHEFARIQSLEDKNELVERLEIIVEERISRAPSAFDVRLVFEELINNALIHAFRRADGSGKYEIDTLSALDDADCVDAGYAVSSRWIGVSVRDNQGLLTKETVLERLGRQYTLAGLMDEGGRGLYLSCMLSAKMLIAIQPGRSTEVTVLFDAEEKPPARTLAIYRGSGRAV